MNVSKLDRPLVFNHITLADQAWLNDNYDKEELIKIFNEMKIEDILRIAVRFFDDKTKEHLATVKIVERDDFGKVKELPEMTLAQKLFRICSEAELMELIKKIFELKKKSAEQMIAMADQFEKKTEIAPIAPTEL